MELPAYDPRGAKAHGLNLATANIGAQHTYGFDTQGILNLPGPLTGEFAEPAQDRLAVRGKGVQTMLNQDYVALYETGIWCAFPAQFMSRFERDYAEMLAAVTGVETFGDSFYLYRVGERIYNLERMFNVREGITGTSDRVPRRFVETPLPDGGSRGQVYEEDELLPQYYRARNWDKNGVPTREKLMELNLGFTAITCRP